MDTHASVEWYDPTSGSWYRMGDYATRDEASWAVANKRHNDPLAHDCRFRIVTTTTEEV